MPYEIYLEGNGWQFPSYLGKSFGRCLWTTWALLTLKCCVGSQGLWTWRLYCFTILAALQSSLWNGRGAPREACFLCEYLLWSPPLNGRFVRSGFPPANNAASPQCKYTFLWGQAHCGWLERPCKDTYFGVPFIYSGQWKINMPVKSIFKKRREVFHLTVLAECKSVGYGIFWFC